MATYAYKWRPIEPPAAPAVLARQEVAALRQFGVRQRQRLEQQQSWRIFVEKMNRWWCIETGAIERIFDLSTRADGSLHEYCPPEHVASEMERLVELYHALPSEYPEVRAAWLHH